MRSCLTVLRAGSELVSERGHDALTGDLGAAEGFLASRQAHGDDAFLGARQSIHERVPSVPAAPPGHYLLHELIDNVCDNSAIDSLFSSLKNESTARWVYSSRDLARAYVFDYIGRL